MAWAEQQRSGRYAGKYRDAAGKVRSVGTFTRKAQAEREAAVKEGESRRDPQAVDPRDGRQTWGHWQAQWFPRRAVQDGSAARDASRMRLHVLPRWGDVALTAIRREDVQDWVLELSRAGLSASSVAHCYHLLSASLRAAVIERRLSASPCQAIRLPTPPPGEQRHLTREEVARIAPVLPEPFRRVFLVLVGTGLRWGELAGLHWHRVDLAGGFLDVVESFDERTRLVKPYPKSKDRRRVWLVDWVVEELAAQQRHATPGPRCLAAHRRDSRCSSTLVFPGDRGATMNYANFRDRHWGRAVGREVWVAAKDPQPGRVFLKPSAARRVLGAEVKLARQWQEGMAGVGRARLHDCRHTFASWLVQAGVPLYDVAEQLGHTSTAVTVRYGHLAGASRPRVLSALSWPDELGSATHPPRASDALSLAGAR